MCVCVCVCVCIGFTTMSMLDLFGMHEISPYDNMSLRVYCGVIKIHPIRTFEYVINPTEHSFIPTLNLFQ